MVRADRMQDPEGYRLVSPSRDGDFSLQGPVKERAVSKCRGGSASLKCVCVAVCTRYVCGRRKARKGHNQEPPDS